MKTKIECKRHRWRVGAGIGEVVNGKLKKTKLCIWCEKCNKKIYARYNAYGLDKWRNKKITKPKKVNLK